MILRRKTPTTDAAPTPEPTPPEMIWTTCPRCAVTWQIPKEPIDGARWTSCFRCAWSWWR
jgi:hypothetical protein